MSDCADINYDAVLDPFRKGRERCDFCRRRRGQDKTFLLFNEDNVICNICLIDAVNILKKTGWYNPSHLALTDNPNQDPPAET